MKEGQGRRRGVTGRDGRKQGRDRNEGGSMEKAG